MHISKYMFGAFVAFQLLNTAHAAGPVVNLSRPTNGASYAVGTPILMRATALSSNATLASLDFVVGTNFLLRFSGPLTNGIYSFMWTNPPAGIHQVHAEAMDDTGAQGVSATAQITVTNPPPPNSVPVVTLTQPTNNSVFNVGTPIFITANATDADGTVSFVEFFRGTLFMGRVDGPSSNGLYQLSWTNPPVGMHQLRAEAVDNAGARGVSALVEVGVTSVTNGTPTNALPIVNWIQPTNGAVFTVGTRILLTANASDPEGNLSTIDFLSGTNLLHRFAGTLTNGVYSFNWSNAPLGGHQLLVRATDERGGTGSALRQISVTSDTNAPPTNLVPVVNWVRPTNGASFAAGSTILLTAQATDADGTVDYVDFFATTTIQPSITVNLGRAFGASTNNLFTLPWTNAPSGTFQLQAVAVDNVGARGFSAFVQVAVSGSTNAPATNASPVVHWISPTNGAVFAAGTPILLRASASDAEWSLSSIDFFVGTNLFRRILNPLTNFVYTVAWSNAPLGSHQLSAIVTNSIGTPGFSTPVQISVTGATNSPPTNNVLPVVNWIRPTNGAVLEPGTPTLLTVNATDSDGTISYVEFYAGSNSLGRGIHVPTNSNYNLTWTNPPPGVFQLRAEAVDNAGGRGASALVQVFVGSPGLVDLGTVEVETIGHLSLESSGHQFLTNAVLDFLIDQDQSSGGGGVLQSVSVNWDTNIQFKLTVAAPPHMKFMVTVPPGRLARFGGFLEWESTRGGFSASGQVTASFSDLEGTAPEFTPSDSVLSDSHGFFGFVYLESTGVSNSFSFTSITLTGTVAPQYTGNGTEDYLPHLESELYLITYSTTDPGGFVSIVPTGPLPMARMMGAPDEHGVDILVYGRPGRTHIVECSTDIVTWIQISSRVMPPAGSMSVTDASATTEGNRFYRVVELP